ncbi:MAG: cytochrome c [Planctomycetales bacterium]|nr:cytochrome c [Planctomycetales bacterium]
MIANSPRGRGTCHLSAGIVRLDGLFLLTDSTVSARDSTPACRSNANGQIARMKQAQLVCVVLAMWLSPGCSEGPAAPVTKGTNELSSRNVERKSEKTQAAVGVENLHRLSDRIYSGGQPEGEAAFASLARLGIKTIVSVDGARPDVATARKHGLRYVQIPLGYDGISEKSGAALARVVRDCDGPIFFHCHHGQHRGPAAAAVACIASGSEDNKSALQILERAGTSNDYPGLWRDVAAFSPPKAHAELPELREVAEVTSLAAAMANIDRRFDLLNLCRAAEWSVPPKHPDVVPAQEALLIKEALHESARHLGSNYDEQFRNWLAESESRVQALETALRSAAHDDATQAFQLLEKSCKQCHAKYRN